MHDFSFLGELVLIGAAAIAIILIFQRLKIPSVIGLIFTGILIGPSGIGAVYDQKMISTLAELGVVLLLFTIGLEFSLEELKKLRKVVLVGGVAQIIATTLVISALASWLMPIMGEPISVPTAFFLGSTFSVSSTAICLKILAEREELSLPYGRIALGILIFQDLAIVPLMLGINMIAPGASSSFYAMMKEIGLVIVLAVAIVLGFRLLMPKLVRFIVSLKAREVLVLGALVICFGAAYLTSLAGLSLALGSFVAGMVIASTDESHQISVIIDPFREAFSSLFFISVGLLLDVNMENLPLFIAIAVVVLLVKGLVVAGIGLFLGNSLRVSMMAGMALAQIGEFSFVLAETGLHNGLISRDIFQAMLVIIVVTMIVTPAMIAVAPKVADQVVPAFGFIPLVGRYTAPPAPTQAVRPPNSAIICAGEIHAAIIGFGVNGQNVAAVLHATNISYSALEIDRYIVKTMRRKGEPIFYGDCTEKKSLLRAGIDHARAVVIGISDHTAISKSIALIRELNEKAYIVVRARTLDTVGDFYRAGADVVVTEKFETSIQIFSQLLNHFTVAPDLILEQQEIIRRECEKIFLK
uniref:Kef-type potassium/proton antiporter, CPA2 family n=1 Tax=Chlorobium chlorochromatii (strain CaD3) TaxID=340177 RepID=Q3AQC0_CHLCH